ncbi:ABC transporter type 1, transmembrane domain-containing protein [Microdochium trichocladiopsis]|uniref:ABC transporter type 1, transmembrane domain-containing protein n=1 Tax=Microdochium trichocladiopsis TaxID=1682393 RepID=A0A9P8Y303_9PEZI|nr:ABC transporter type 1, transmembrane domain-containing protein [Microdochium trichocladiopsis]KAH7028788.1 ABC transporter type 1, transmembrane domain-containing protein [Microdochium trichocladiopsis]
MGCKIGHRALDRIFPAYEVSVSFGTRPTSPTLSASLVTSSLAFFALSVLPLLIHDRQRRPSSLLTIYFLALLFLDLTLLLAPSAAARPSVSRSPSSIRAIASAVLLLLESYAKDPMLEKGTAAPPPEDSYGILERTLFIWVNRILLKGYRGVLADKDMPRLGYLQSPKNARNTMIYQWQKDTNALGIFSPSITLAIFATLSSMNGLAFNTETAFTAIAVLGLVTHPANMVMTIVPRAIATLAGFERIQAYLIKHYIRFAGKRSILFLCVCTASYAFFITVPQYWLDLWTADGGKHLLFYVSGYGLLSLASWLSTNGTMWSTHIRLAAQSGISIHDYLLQTILSAPLSFFSKTDDGSILNRFSQDIQLVDRQLPSALANLLNQIFKLLVQTVVLFSVQRLMWISLPMCAATVYVIQKGYLRTSRQLRFLELETKAFVFSDFLDLVEGLETIRAFKWQRKIVQKNIACLESSQRPELCLLSLQRWLNLVLDFWLQQSPYL